VQIAPHNDGDWNDWAHIRRCQEFVTHQVPHTYLCTLVHTGEADNIHPTKKHHLAVELKDAVLTHAFGYDVEYCGPVYDKAEKTENGVTITFTHADGLRFDGDPTDLTVYDAAGNPLPYTAAIEGNALTLTADGVARIELGWQNSCAHNLYNGCGYLASPFQIIL
jgi:sialate O-acetylesterase